MHASGFAYEHSALINCRFVPEEREIDKGSKLKATRATERRHLPEKVLFFNLHLLDYLQYTCTHYLHINDWSKIHLDGIILDHQAISMLANASWLFIQCIENQ